MSDYSDDESQTYEESDAGSEVSQIQTGQKLFDRWRKSPTSKQVRTLGTTDNGKKIYTVVETSRGEVGGKYVGAHPSIAARKAASVRFRGNKSNTVTLTLRQHHHQDLFTYRVDKRRLPTPKVVGNITYEYENVVTPL